jgi:hypothetical protein
MATRRVSGGKSSPGMAGGTYTRSAKKDVKAAIKTAKKTKPLAEPKSAVKTKTAAKQRPGKKDIMTLIKKRAIRNEQIKYAERGDDFVNSGIRPGGPYSQGKTKLLRQIKASKKSK